MHNKIIKDFKILFQDSKVVHQRTRWLGRKAQKCPTDAWVYQQLIYKLKPDFIIETGTAHGGGALFLASICDMVEHGQVITIENDPARPSLPLTHKRIIQLRGSSTDDEVFRQVKESIKGGTAIVILDSNHSRKHVTDELKLYSTLVKKDFYLIIEDTGMPQTHYAVETFLSLNPNFVVDQSCERFLLTFNPGGFLKHI